MLLPKRLELVHIAKAIEFVEDETTDLVELYHEQANVFSAVVGIFGQKALHAFSPYKKHKHPDVAQQRFPDLSLGGKPNPPPELALESKGSSRPWAIQSHYDHPGWYVVWRYLVDPTRKVKPGREVVVWRVDVVFLNKEDWKYEGSTAGHSGGGRTHTFGLKCPADKLRGAAAFELPGVALKGGRPVMVEVIAPPTR
ncbi:MAG: hypothetical protein HYZ28_15345 [Myxococcales bacterium]|nr:hypothetical protein [Myxococcales bacterium]